MAHQTLTIWYSDGTTRDIALEPGVYHAGSDLSCDIHFHPDDAIPRFEIEIQGLDGAASVTPRQAGVFLDGEDLPLASATAWPPGARLTAGTITMAIASGETAAAARAGAQAAAPSPKALFGVSLALALGYFATGLFDTGSSADTQTALASPTHTMTIREASAEVRRLVDGWPNPVKPTMTVGARQMTIRLQDQAAGNAALLAHIESFRLNPDETIAVLDVPYSDEQFTALGIDALALRPRKAVITRLGTTVGIGETLGTSWQLKDITAADVTVSRGSLTKSIRLKGM